NASFACTTKTFSCFETWPTDLTELMSLSHHYADETGLSPVDAERVPSRKFLSSSTCLVLRAFDKYYTMGNKLVDTFF
ncbi:mCG144873, partial [Mus musculus]